MENTGGNTFFEIRDRKNRFVHQGVTPERVTLRAKSYPFWPARYNVTFAGSGNTTQTNEVKAGFDPWIAGNLLVGGIAGAVVDGATGAMFRLPDQVTGHVPAEHVVANKSQGTRLASAHLCRDVESSSADFGTRQASFQIQDQSADSGATVEH